MRCLISLLLLLIITNLTNAAHIVGGELLYDCLGNGNYQITLKVYRDCNGGGAQFDNPAAVTIYNAANQQVANLRILNPIITNVPATIIDPCYQVGAGVCVEEAIYSTNIQLATSSGGFTATYQRCCRNRTILNIVAPGNHGASFTAHIPSADVRGCNSSPRFNEKPPLAVCMKSNAVIDQSATDPDGDSLVYKLCNALDGGGMDGVNGGIATSFTGVRPDPAAPPAYDSIQWLPQFNQDYPIPSNPGFSIDSKTGVLSGSPTKTGQYVFAVCVEEYRDGKLIGLHRREYQMNVVHCNSINIAKIEPQVEACKGFRVKFNDISTNAVKWHWDFGVNSLFDDTSNFQNPLYKYPDTGTYDVTLIINPGLNCADTTVEKYRVYEMLNPNFTPPDTQCFNQNSFSFSAGGAFQSQAQFNWNFGIFANPANSISKDPSNISFSQSGNFPITLTIEENGCIESYIDTISIIPNPNLDYSISSNEGCAPHFVNFNDNSTAETKLHYKWSFGNGTNSEIANPKTVFIEAGVYYVNLMVYTKTGCIDTLIDDIGKSITVYPVPHSGFLIDEDSISISDAKALFIDRSQEGLNCIQYFGDGNYTTNCDVEHIYEAPGKYLTSQVVTNEFGCNDTTQRLLVVQDEYYIHIPNAFTPNFDGINDVFKPIISGVKEYLLVITDRWGKVVFSTIDPFEGWDGIVKSEKRPADNSIYKYQIKIVNINDEPRVYSGFVVLLR